MHHLSLIPESIIIDQIHYSVAKSSLEMQNDITHEDIERFFYLCRLIQQYWLELPVEGSWHVLFPIV